MNLKSWLVYKYLPVSNKIYDNYTKKQEQEHSELLKVLIPQT